MPKSSNQKLKLLYIAQYLRKQSDEEHPVGMSDILSYLESNGISAERKSVYDDLDLLTNFGMDIIRTRTKTTGYYLGSREFELAELKLLVDSVQSSKFITEKKTLSLIKKIEELASSYDAKKLHRQVLVTNRVKSMNESVYYNVDIIHDAISDDKMVEFRYFNYTMTKQREFHRDGAVYFVSPFFLVWDDENYYLIGYDREMQQIRHFRVDKMTDAKKSDQQRMAKDLLSGIDLTAYSKRTFGMFSGKTEKVHMLFHKSLAGAVLDRFGKNTFLSAVDSNHFAIWADVAVSPQFYAWVLGFGADAEILEPEDVRTGLKDHMQKVFELYDR